MAPFFINRPIVAIVISILMVIIGLVAMVQLPIALYPNIAPPEILLTARYPGADAVTLEQSVATPIEQQMSGVDNMLYMYSLNQGSGSQMQLRVDFDVTTDPSVDQVLTNLRYSQAASQLPPDVVNQGVTVTKSVTSPLGIFALYSPKGTYDPLFLANYAYVNINDPMTRVPGIGQVLIFGASQYAIRLWVNPDTLAKLDITVSEIASALQAQNTVNPAGQLGGDPVPPGQEFTYTVLAQGRLASLADFENVVVRARPDGALVRVKDVARVELGAQNYIRRGRLNGQPAALVAVYQLPGSNAIDTMRGATKLMEEIKARFPADLDYVTSLDTTLAVSAGIKEIVKTLVEALVLVIIVVFVFLQSFRATLIPLLAVPVALVGAFMIFPLLGFSINTLSLFGLVLAIGLVVDDAIVVVEAVERHIEDGLSPRDAAFKAMEQVSGPVVAIALILAAVFVPTAFIPGITGRMYQQFAVTIAVSVLISAFNALTLSPALSALLLRPRRETRGPLGAFFRGFNRWFARATDGYVGACGHLIRKSGLSRGPPRSIAAVFAGLISSRLPGRLRPRRGSGVLLRQRPASAGRVAGPHRGRQRQARRHLQDDAGHQVLHRRGRLQPAEPGDDDLQRVLLHHAGRLGRAGQAGAHGRRDDTAAEPAAGRRGRGPGLRLRTARHPGHRDVRGRDVHAGGSRGQGSRVPGREYDEVPRRRAKATRVCPALHHPAAEHAAILCGRSIRKRSSSKGSRSPRSTRPFRRSWAAPS